MVFEDRTLSYAALDAHANRLAHHLQSLGVGPETMVGLCVERSPEMVVGLLGILKAGGAYLPLDPNYPRERLAFMLADAGCPVLVTQAALLDRLPEAAAAQLVRLDADWPAIARQPGTAPPLDLDPRPPGLRHLHLGLDRQRQRASWSSIAALPILLLAQTIASIVAGRLAFCSLHRRFRRSASEIATAVDRRRARCVVPADERGGDALANLIVGARCDAR